MCQIQRLECDPLTRKSGHRGPEHKEPKPNKCHRPCLEHFHSIFCPLILLGWIGEANTLILSSILILEKGAAHVFNQLMIMI